jgi:hypothetical protein
MPTLWSMVVALAAGREPHVRSTRGRRQATLPRAVRPRGLGPPALPVALGWEYKLEAHVPARKRRMGHYAMPMLWGEQMLGWANLKVVDGRLLHELGFVGPRPRSRAFQLTLDEALQQMQLFLDL